MVSSDTHSGLAYLPSHCTRKPRDCSAHGVRKATETFTTLKSTPISMMPPKDAAKGCLAPAADPNKLGASPNTKSDQPACREAAPGRPQDQPWGSVGSEHLKATPGFRFPTSRVDQSVHALAQTPRILVSRSGARSSRPDGMQSKTVLQQRSTDWMEAATSRHGESTNPVTRGFAERFPDPQHPRVGRGSRGTLLRSPLSSATPSPPPPNLRCRGGGSTPLCTIPRSSFRKRRWRRK